MTSKENNQGIQIKLNPWILAFLGLITSVTGLLTGVLDILENFIQFKDPFLKFYFIAAIILCISFWLIMKYFSGEEQRKSSRILFITIASISSLVVLWRYLDVSFYLKNPSQYPLPVGFKHQPDYLPYALMLTVCIFIVLTLIFLYTQKKENKGNGIPIMSWFFGMAIYLVFCRIMWHVVDSLVLVQGIIN